MVLLVFVVLRRRRLVFIGFPRVSNDSIEAVVFVSCVVDLSDGPVGLLHHVVSLHRVPFASLRLTFEVSRVMVVYFILELVVRLVLEQNILFAIRLLPIFK